MARRLHEIRGLEVAVALEILWAAFLLYEVYWKRPLRSAPWDQKILFLASAWAAPAIAIVVIVWLVKAARR
ncbi:MAG TPA: hypothetical protein VJN72_13605 [Gaiellales bacterium]|nr:hypothetical protein [Gaiellales bacterium]